MESIYTFKAEKEQSFLFDTNVWLLLNFPGINSNPKISSAYSNLYSDLVNKKNDIYISPVILSEVINVALRTDFAIRSRLPDSNIKNFKKDYRGSEYFLSCLKNISKQMKKILKNSKLMVDGISKEKCLDLLSSNEEFDFNDQIIISNLQGNKNIIFVTNDSDFKKYDSELRVISALR